MAIVIVVLFPTPPFRFAIATAFNLAMALACRGKRVLAIDNDSQGNLTILSGYDHNKLDEERSLAELTIRKCRASLK
jgi:hypothetical protein